MSVAFDVAALLQLVTLFGVVLGAGAWLWKTAVRINELLRRIEQLEERMKHRKADVTIMLGGLSACLKGLEKQGCNGPVTQAIADIEKYLLESR